MGWRVVLEPHGENPGRVAQVAGAVASAAGSDTQVGKNTGGLVIYVTNGASKDEVSRVGFIRRNTKNPRVTFEKQLDAELAKARKAAQKINELLAESSESPGELL